MKKRYEFFLFKNTLAIAFPAVAVFLVLIFFLFKYPIFDKLECNLIEKERGAGNSLEKKLDELFTNETYNVMIEAKNLYYTGFDYYSDNEKKGSYYYTIEGQKAYIFLLSNKYVDNKLSSIKIKGKIIRDSSSVSHILDQLSQANGIANLAETGFYSEYIVSEPDYPNMFIVLVYIFYATPIIICVIIFLYTAVMCLNPKLHPQSKQLMVYGKPKKIIKDINRQLRNDYVYKKGNIYITSNYLIVSYVAKTDVVKLDMVKYLSKNEAEKKVFMGREKTMYRITLSSPDVLFYEVDFYDESICDDVLDYIETMKA